MVSFVFGKTVNFNFFELFFVFLLTQVPYSDIITVLRSCGGIGIRARLRI